MKIHLATDHAGYEMKEVLKTWLIESGHDVVDHGADEFVSTDDYPDFIKKAAVVVASSTEDRAIILGGSGQGEAIVANKFSGVRTAVYYGGNFDIVRIAREHNDINILSLGARFVSFDEAKTAVQVFIDTPFSGDDRHVRRLGKITEIETQ